MAMGEAVRHGEGTEYGDSLYLPFICNVDLKLLLKRSLNLKKKKKGRERSRTDIWRKRGAPWVLARGPKAHPVPTV